MSASDSQKDPANLRRRNSLLRCGAIQGAQTPRASRKGLAVLRRNQRVERNSSLQKFDRVSFRESDTLAARLRWWASRIRLQSCRLRTPRRTNLRNVLCKARRGLWEFLLLTPAATTR